MALMAATVRTRVSVTFMVYSMLQDELMD